MTTKEINLYNKLMECAHEKSKWVSLLYFLIAKFGVQGETFKLVIEKSSEVPVPTLDNHLEWEYNAETDTVTLEIKEPEPEKKIITLGDGKIESI